MSPATMDDCMSDCKVERRQFILIHISNFASVSRQEVQVYKAWANKNIIKQTIDLVSINLHWFIILPICVGRHIIPH